MPEPEREEKREKALKIREETDPLELIKMMSVSKLSWKPVKGKKEFSQLERDSLK